MPWLSCSDFSALFRWQLGLAGIPKACYLSRMSQQQATGELLSVIEKELSDFEDRECFGLVSWLTAGALQKRLRYEKQIQKEKWQGPECLWCLRKSLQFKRIRIGQVHYAKKADLLPKKVSFSFPIAPQPVRNAASWTPASQNIFTETPCNCWKAEEDATVKN